MIEGIEHRRLLHASYTSQSFHTLATFRANIV
jgi:hypothetical protein